MTRCLTCDVTFERTSDAVNHAFDNPTHVVSARPLVFQDRYLGDGVYASFDGYQIWLAVNDHHNRIVALEPGVMERLFEYAASVGVARK